MRNLTIGRSPSCDFVVDDVYASQIHASLTQREDGSVWLRDEGSINGTKLNGQTVWGSARVYSGDVIRVGRTEVTVP